VFFPIDFAHAIIYLMKKVITEANGFTIIELLVVIAIIGILAAITLVSYTGVSSRATTASLQSDLSSAATLLKLFQTTDVNDYYPATINCAIPDSSTNKCIKSSSGNTYTYTPNNSTNPRTFSLDATNNGTTYRVTDSTATVLVNDWIVGIAATALAGKLVRNTDLSTRYEYKISNDADASPQSAIGLDPNYLSNMSLVNPQTNPAVSFSNYPAQNACKVLGGRLPNMQELLAIYSGRVTYGNNFGANTTYLSSTESTSSLVNDVTFDGNFRYLGTHTKSALVYIRCVSG
jgi:prepilin-type N-terminal cleavage/methylation domain-containing protein